MSRLASCNESDLQPETLTALEPVRVNGRLAEVYLQFANSEAALRAYLHMEESLRACSLSSREIEAVKLWVSEQTQCGYCLSVHTFKAGKSGLEKDTQLRIRRNEPTGEARLDELLRVAAAVYRKPGKLDDAILVDAREAGLSDQNLVDLTLTISTIFFTNITNHINDSESPLPPAPAIES